MNYKKLINRIKRYFLLIRKYGIKCELVKFAEKFHIKTNLSSAEIIARYNSKIDEKDLKFVFW